MVEVGPKAVDAVLSWENLYAHNRKIVDPIANRYFFVHDPRRIAVKNLPRAFTAQVPLHPDYRDRGFRSFKVKPEKGVASFWVSGGDMKVLAPGKKVRFMGLFNFQVERVDKGRIEAVFHSEPYEEAKKLGMPLIHWVPVGTGIQCEVVMPDASMAKGVAENACKRLQQGEIIQFERFGFVRVDSLDEKLAAYFAHR